mmetsp:Transcript_6950/g.6123  ORF Transcript_6950/g.6123 Transcript_6950/m.6123 type:complete len:451 (+) Transcript_6950:32-1384(+)
MTILGKYKLIKKIGQGGFSKVMLAEDVDTGEKVALKIMKSSENKSGKQKKVLFENEITALKDLDHKSILKLKDYSHKEFVKNSFGKLLEVNYISMEYAQNGEFFDYIAEGEKFSEKTVRFFFHRIIESLDYIHSQGYSHRDIKPENLLFDSEFNLKLADFGFSTKKLLSSERRGTFGYMAPEVLAQFEHDPKRADLFSAGVLLFIMMTKHCPFIRSESTDKYYRHIVKKDYEGFWKLHESSNGENKAFSDSFKDLMNGLLSLKPSERYTLDEIKSHDWFTSPVNSDEDIKFEFKMRRKILVGVNEPSDQNENADMVSETKEDEKHADQTPTTNPSSDNEDDDVEMDSNISSDQITEYIEVLDGDILVDAVTSYCLSNQIAFEKSKNFYRVKVEVGEGKEKTKMEVDILKRKRDCKRAIQFKLKTGSKEQFYTIFNNFQDFFRVTLLEVDN